MEIISASYLISSAAVGGCPKANKPEYAFIGRSNVGKSSLINMLCNRSKLAKISATPGKTRLINHFEIVSDDKRAWYLVDLPGYGYAKVAQKQRKGWSKMIEDYIRKRENLVTLFVLIDSRHAPQDIDLSFVNQLGEWQIPFVLVFTKSDKNKDQQTHNQVQAFLTAMKESWAEIPPYFITSAVKKEGRNELLAYIKKLNATLPKFS
ncbi:MAG TPA: ribosome biogenesis GTP-binding protein YihA/YsxC [Chitinophagaceae bacterium]|jgi:GTP-binding protein|nr:ribosome biogenesis GTP-binding protein YihA/YsxC [Chitinophagaceae bacterium]